jgi:hypothetical protein
MSLDGNDQRRRTNDEGPTTGVQQLTTSDPRPLYDHRRPSSKDEILFSVQHSAFVLGRSSWSIFGIEAYKQCRIGTDSYQKEVREPTFPPTIIEKPIGNFEEGFYACSQMFRYACGSDLDKPCACSVWCSQRQCAVHLAQYVGSSYQRRSG